LRGLHAEFGTIVNALAPMFMLQALARQCKNTLKMRGQMTRSSVWSLLPPSLLAVCRHEDFCR
jgi:hypothetical protein